MRHGTQIEVRVVTDPAGRPAVLLQLEDGWVVLLPDDARVVADMILAAADEIDDA
jgi:hypothetical protein